MAEQKRKRCGFVWPQKRKASPASSLETTHLQGDETHRCSRPDGHTGPHRCDRCYARTAGGVTVQEQPRCGYVWQRSRLRDTDGDWSHGGSMEHRCNRPWPHTGPHRCEKCSARTKNCPHDHVVSDQSGIQRCRACWTPLDDNGRQRVCLYCKRPFWNRNVGPHCSTCQPPLPMKSPNAESERGAAPSPAEA